MLVGLRDFPWEEFDIDRKRATALREVSPTEEHVRGWHR